MASVEVVLRRCHSLPAPRWKDEKGDAMKSYVYKNAEFMGYKITRNGSVYLPNKKGVLSRIKGTEANLVLRKYIAAIRIEEDLNKEA